MYEQLAGHEQIKSGQDDAIFSILLLTMLADYVK